MLVGINAIEITLPLFFCEKNQGSSNLLNRASWKSCLCGGMMARARTKTESNRAPNSNHNVHQRPTSITRTDRQQGWRAG